MAELLTLSDVAVAPALGVAPVLAGVTLGVAAGECVALVGRSGAGKTSLLRTIGGQLRPQAGSVRFGGADPADLQVSARRHERARIGMVAQRHDLIDALRVHRNVMAGALGRWSNVRALRNLLRASADELVEAEAALASVGLAHKLHARTSQLSGGEAQRVAIARVLVQAPILLLADEPVASLDRGNAEQVMELLTRLARERGMALVCSLHQPDLAERYCDRTVELADGKVRELTGRS